MQSFTMVRIIYRAGIFKSPATKKVFVDLWSSCNIQGSSLNLTLIGSFGVQFKACFFCGPLSGIREAMREWSRNQLVGLTRFGGSVVAVFCRIPGQRRDQLYNTSKLHVYIAIGYVVCGMTILL